MASLEPVKTAPADYFSTDGRSFGRLVVMALVLSLVLHVGLGLWFGWIKLDNIAVPGQTPRDYLPFDLKRVEINPAALKGAVATPATMTPVAQSPQPAPRLSVDAQAVQSALNSARPQMTVPAPPDSGALANESLGSSPYSYSEQANVAAEVARFEVGPLTSMPELPSTHELPTDMFGTGSGTGGAGGGGAQGAPQPGSAAPPGFDDLVGEFRLPDPGLNPRLPEPVLLRLPSDLLFDFDSDQFRPQALSLLTKAADMIAQYPLARIQVDGHTDTIGTEVYNRDLSLRRAKVAEAWLKQQLPPSKYSFEARGFGKSRPLVNPNGTADEQQANRRVEIVIQALRP